jgi:hypothetical protein
MFAGVSDAIIDLLHHRNVKLDDFLAQSATPCRVWPGIGRRTSSIRFEGTCMYKAFISSTYEDLLGHRAEAIRALQSAGFLVDQMENWQADRDAPARFSPARLDGCNLCLLLVAFRRGTVPRGAARSITQIEYDEARRRGIDVLPFLLNEQTPVGAHGWPARFDERESDPGINDWHQTLRQTHGVGEFGADPKSLRIEAALARWVVQAESDRAAKFRRTVTAILCAFFFLVAIAASYAWHAYETPDLRNRYHSSFLAFHDPVAFNNSRSGLYSIARVLASTDALRLNTNLNAEFGSTQFSLDLLANNVGYIHDQIAHALRDMIGRGANVRFILWDYTPENQQSYDAFQIATRQSPLSARGDAPTIRRQMEALEQDVASDREKYKGTFELRWNRRPLLYTMWIRDWDAQKRSNTLGHLGVHFYSGQPEWPSFRVSDLDGPDLLDNMHREFEYAWQTSAKTIPPSN